MQEAYKTIAENAVSTFIEKKSEFISYVFCIKSEHEAIEHINEIRKKHYDATHNVYAYILKDNNIARFSDDGEPGGTAGLPTMEVLKKEGVLDVLVVTTRYFGGTMLGAGGLVRAYSHSAKLGLLKAGIITKTLYETLKFSCAYANEGKIKNVIEAMGANLSNVTYFERVSFEINILPNKEEEFTSKINEICGESVNFDKMGSIYG